MSIAVLHSSGQMVNDILTCGAADSTLLSLLSLLLPIMSGQSVSLFHPNSQSYNSTYRYSSINRSFNQYTQSLLLHFKSFATKDPYWHLLIPFRFLYFWHFFLFLTLQALCLMTTYYIDISVTQIAAKFCYCSAPYSYLDPTAVWMRIILWAT